ncbi:hypothetical protein [Nocardia abscessus]|uniref:hypothetical protein n=1 Tax=Nocardia abscessus TaxID=120957 RepID=UPI00245643D6|nr:hypothetical protein [Nocardia abscessus]
MTPKGLPGRGGLDAARIAHRPTLLAAQDSDIADTDCAVDPGDVMPDDAIRSISVHHHCPSPCHPRALHCPGHRIQCGQRQARVDPRVHWTKWTGGWPN